MYTYQDIAFRAIEEKDLNTLKHLHNDKNTFLNLATIDLVDDNNQKKWWASLNNKKNDKRYVICLSEEPNVILGRLRIQNIDNQNRNCELGLDIIPEERGKGWGYKSYQMLLDFVFNHYNMNMVYLKVADFNPEAKQLYSKVGFKKSGFLPKYFYRHGKYWDYIIMSLTKQSFDKINSI